MNNHLLVLEGLGLVLRQSDAPLALLLRLDHLLLRLIELLELIHMSVCQCRCLLVPHHSLGLTLPRRMRECNLCRCWPEGGLRIDVVRNPGLVELSRHVLSNGSWHGRLDALHLCFTHFTSGLTSGLEPSHEAQAAQEVPVEMIDSRLTSPSWRIDLLALIQHPIIEFRHYLHLHFLNLLLQLLLPDLLDAQLAFHFHLLEKHANVVGAHRVPERSTWCGDCQGFLL